MPIHHVKMQPIGAGGGHGAHLLAGTGKVGRQKAGGNEDGHGLF